MVSFLDPQCIHVVAITKTQHLVMCLERRTPIATRDVQDVHLPLPDRDRPSSPHGNEYPLKQTRRAMIDSTKHDRSPSKNQNKSSKIDQTRNMPRTSRKAQSTPQKPSSPRATTSGRKEVATTQARRVDKTTGITWVEVEYRPWNSAEGPHYSFENIVTN